MMISKTIILDLQQLYFDAEDLKKYNLKNLECMLNIMQKYQDIITQLYCQYPDVFDNVFHIGLKEIIDHLIVLRNAVPVKAKMICFIDLQFYLQQSILDARFKVINHSSRAVNT